MKELLVLAASSVNELLDSEGNIRGHLRDDQLLQNLQGVVELGCCQAGLLTYDAVPHLQSNCVRCTV